MYIVHCRVIVDNRCEFQHSSSHVDCNFDARLVCKTQRYCSTKKLRKHVCQLIVVKTIQSVQAWSTASRPIQSVEAIADLIPPVSALSVTARSWALKVLAKWSGQSVFKNFLAASCHCVASCHCGHHPFIVRSAQNRSLVSLSLHIRLDVRDQR